MGLKKGCARTSPASLGPPPSLLVGSLVSSPDRTLLATSESLAGNLTSSCCKFEDPRNQLHTTAVSLEMGSHSPPGSTQTKLHGLWSRRAVVHTSSHTSPHPLPTSQLIGRSHCPPIPTNAHEKVCTHDTLGCLLIPPITFINQANNASQL